MLNSGSFSLVYYFIDVALASGAGEAEAVGQFLA
jgi:hypothetical protein